MFRFPRPVSNDRRRLARSLVVPALLAAGLGGLAACSSDTASTGDQADLTTPEPARGAADGVKDLSEGGKNLDENLNVPGSETDREVDDSPAGDDG